MSDITQTRLEVARGETEHFLQRERGVGIDGSSASDNLRTSLETRSSAAADFLRRHRHGKLDGLFVPLGVHNAAEFDQASMLLAGCVILVPSTSVDQSVPHCFFPGIVSQHTTYDASMRLHVLKQPFRGSLGYGASMILSAAGQAETDGVGEHGKTPHDGLEAEHFMALLAAPEAWESTHINHEWKQSPETSVTTELTGRLLGAEVPQATITISQGHIASGKIALFWHENLTNRDTNRPEDGSQDSALIVIQALGFEALQNSNPEKLNTIQRLIS